MNFSATFNVFRLIINPSLCLPQFTFGNFNEINFNVLKSHKIKAIVLDKDNCFAKDQDSKVHHEYQVNWKEMQEVYPNANLVIVSNSTGLKDDTEAQILQKNTNLKVLIHKVKKPGCYVDILHHFKSYKPYEIAIIGDRLFTDVLMANIMGSHSVWLRNGVSKSNNLICRFERFFHDLLINNNYEAPKVK